MTQTLAINQIGYFVSGVKTGVLAKAGAQELSWTLTDVTTKTKVASGKTSPGTVDAISGDTVHVADFSSFDREGSYVLEIDSVLSSPFTIGREVLASLAKDALHYFYLTRSGIELKPEFAGTSWARPAGHLSDAEITAYEGPDAQGRLWKTYDYKINGLGGWYDAGDYGKYVVNGGIAVWTLQNAYERNPAAFQDGAQAIPEAGNGIPDILDEARWETNFLLNMQIPSGKPLEGMAFHKLHDRKWSGVPAELPTHFDNNNEHQGADWGRFVFEPTTAATLNLAATAAQAARLWKKWDPAFADRCVKAAKTAWEAARAHPDLLAGNVPGAGGGNYDDLNVADEFYWAAAELYATTGEKLFLDFVTTSPYFHSFPGLEAAASSSMSWADTAALGSITLAVVKTGLPQGEVNRLHAQIVATADRYLEILAGQGYRVPAEASAYVWGSTSLVLNNAVILALAYDFTNKAAYRDGVIHALDYLLGMNANLKCFVTGYGSNPVLHPHHRIWGNDPDAGVPPPPPGLVAGGPNANIQDPEMEAAQLKVAPIAKRYLDTIGSYATNEVAINWNAPLVWVSHWLDQQYNQR